jgi:hypothetical protein
MQAQIYSILEEDHPQSVRHVYYRMTDPRLPCSVPKTDNGYRLICRELVKMRVDGSIPYDWISDTSRAGYFVTGYASSSDFIENMAGHYRGEMWRDLPAFPEVWCESRSIAGVLLDTCQEYGVSLYPSGGFSSLTFIYEAARHLNRIAAGRTVHALYVGDYDPAGVLIDQDIERKLRSHLVDVELVFKRVGITEEQVLQYDLPTKPRKEGDRRAQHVAETVEAEAMPAATLRGLIVEEFEALIPDGHFDVVKAAEESEQAYLVTLADAVRGAGR